MSTCNFCKSEDIDDGVERCPVCGCSAEMMRTGKTAKEADILRDVIIRLSSVAILIGLLFGCAFLFPRGARPEQSTIVFVSVVSAALVGAIIYGIVLLVLHAKKIHHPDMRIVQGETVALRRGAAGVRHTRTKYGIVEFDVNGKTYRHVGVREAGSIPKIGATVDIAYNVDDPFENYIAKDRRGVMVIVAALIGVVFVAVMTWLIFVVFGQA